jgi:hypothetical protein
LHEGKYIHTSSEVPQSVQDLLWIFQKEVGVCIKVRNAYHPTRDLDFSVEDVHLALGPLPCDRSMLPDNAGD